MRRRRDAALTTARRPATQSGMEGHSSSPNPQLRVQLTLVAAGRTPAARANRFHTSLRIGTQKFACEVIPEQTLAPGGRAVHCGVAFAMPDDAAPLFPPGALFEVWESGRVGYGTVLAVLRRN